MENTRFEGQLRLIGQGGSAEILELLLGLSPQEFSGLQFFVYYKEIPIFSTAELCYLFDDTLVCRATPLLSRAIRACRYLLIRSPKLSHDIYASAEVNADSGETILSAFSYVDVLPDRRGTVRVKIGGFFQVDMEAGLDTFKAVLRELSLGGCALEVPDKSLLKQFTYFFLNLTFDLKNNSSPQKLRVMSRLLRFESNDAPCRCILQFEHDTRSEDLIGMYIAQRQAEIIRELKI